MSVIFGIAYRDGINLDIQQTSSILEEAKLKGRRPITLHESNDFLFGYHDFGEPDRIMKSDDGRYVIMMGGECFGRKTALQKLQCTGAPDYNKQPVAFLWFLYQKFGSEAFRWLDGHFCLVFYDTLEKRITFIKDPVGQHPLFYIQQEGFLAFSSEYQIITKLPGWDTTINKQSLVEFFAYGMILDGRTPLNGLKSLPYASEFQWKNSHCCRLSRYEEWNYQQEPSLTLAESADLVYHDMRERLLEKISDNRIKELPLSGGFDTRFVLALLPPDVRNSYSYYTNCSPYLNEKEDRDVIVASLIAKQLGLCHEVKKLSPENISINDGSFLYESIRPENDYTNINGHFSLFIKGEPIDHISGNFFEFDESFLKTLRFYVSNDIIKWAKKEAQRYTERVALLHTGNKEWLHFFLNVGQCFMNSYEALNGGKWVNPVVFFLQNLRSPFQDASLLRNLLCIPHKHLNNGNLFISIYKRHAPELLKIPFVRIYFPESNKYYHLLNEIDQGSLYQTQRKRIWEQIFKNYLFSKKTWKRNLYSNKFRIALIIKWILEYALADISSLGIIREHWRYKRAIPPMSDQTFVRIESWLRTYKLS